MIKDMLGNIVQGYSKKGYNLATAKIIMWEAVKKSVTYNV